MADIDTDLSDLGTKDPQQRSMANAYDLSDLGEKVQETSWRNKPIDVKKDDLSDLGTREPESKAYTLSNGQVHFSVERPSTALSQAVADGVIDQEYADNHKDDFFRAQVKYNDFQEAAGSGQVAKALLHGAGRGGAFLAGAIPGGKAGAAIGALVPGAEEITVPVGATIGSLTTGTIAAWSYGKAVDKLSDYNDFVKSFAASAELHPVANAAGELTAFAASAPKSIAKLIELGKLDLGEGTTAARALLKSPAVAAQVTKGAVGGAAFEGVIRPGFDVARHLIADQLGIPHEATQAPTMTSMAQNVALGILTAGHSVEFRDFSAGETANLILRAKAREAAGIPLNDDNPAEVIKGFEAIGADPSADLQGNGLLRPLDTSEISVYAALNTKMEELKASGELGAKEVASLTARQATIPGRPGQRIPISRASITLRDRTRTGEPNAVNPVIEQAGVQPQRSGVDEVREEGTGAGVGDSLPSTTGQPPETQGVSPAVPAPVLSPKVASPQWQVTVQKDEFDPQSNQVVPGYIQIDSVRDGQNEWSSSPDKLTAQGYTIPDFSKLPGGRYTFGEAMQMLVNPSTIKPTKPVGVSLSPSGDIPKEPTPAQKEAGNYKMQHVKVQGLDISIENPVGSVRSGTDAGGKPWSVTMKRDYGYIKGTVGRDKDHLDVYLGPDLNSDNVFVIDQINPTTGKFDEHKVMLGYRADSAGQARMDYAAHFSDGKGNSRVGGMTGMTMADFKEWIKNGHFTEPLSSKKAVAPPVPETPETINEQVKMLTDGKRKAILITKGEKKPSIPRGMVSVPGTPFGTVIYNPDQLTHEQVVAAINENRLGDILGYGIPDKPAPGTEVGAVVVRTPAGVEKQGVLTDAEHLPAVKAAAEAVASPGDVIDIESEATVIKKRQRGPSVRTVAKSATPPTLPTDVNEPAEGASGSISVGGGEPATVGEAGGGRATGAIAEGSAGQVQPGIRPENAGTTGERGGGDSRIADADVNGVPAEPRPEAAVIPSADTGVQTGSDFRGEPSETNPAPESEFGDALKPKNIRLSENPAPTGAVARIKANVDAISLVKKLETEQRDPTEEERKTLAMWSGWGSFKELFNEGRAERREWDAGWMKKYGTSFDKLKKLLTAEEFNAAAESSVNAHYTSQEVVSAMWSLVRRLGYDGGRALEPSTGSGVFVGYSPDDIAGKTRWTGVEMEPMTGKIFKYLYPEVDTRIQPFENTKLPNGFYDLVITNVPFHEVGPGKEYPDLNLHNYFIARSLDKTKPGGLVAVVTTSYTMESRHEQRSFLAEKGQLVGAIRLPNNAFKESAATEVVTDIIVLRKPSTTPFEGAQPWKNTVEIEVGDATTRINEYFATHPEMVLGKHALTGTMYRKDSYTVESTPGSLADKLAAAIARFPENITKSAPVTIEPSETKLEEGALTIDDKGHVLEARNFLLQPPVSWSSASGSLVKRAKLYIGLRDTLKRQYALEDDPAATDAEIEANRANLNRAYRALHKDVDGPINQNERKMGYLSSDPDFYTVMGIEVFREAQDPKNPEGTITVVEPAAVLSQRVKSPDVPPTRAENATEALGISMAYRGRLDMDYVKELTSMPQEAIEAELMSNDLGFKDPDSAEFVTSMEYLTGDVRDKLAKAIFAAKESEEFMRNVESLRKVIPETIPFGKIRLGLSARWVPPAIFNQFAKEIIGLNGDEITFVPGIEEFSVKGTRSLSAQAKANWATLAMGTYDLLAHAMNFRRAKIMVSDGKDKYFEDTQASALANQVIDNMGIAFQEWVRTSESRLPYRYFDTERGDYVTAQLPIWDVLEREFNRTKNSFVPPANDGTMLKLPGLSNLVTRKQHLVDGVMRAIVQGSSVYGHGVGSGKTYLAIVVMHELQRIGLMKKGIVVIKKPTVDQFRISLERAYPGSRVLMPNEKDFKPANRKKLTARIASGKFDFIVLTHEQFKSIRTSEEAVNSFFNDQIEQLRNILRDMGEEKAEDSKSTRGLDPAVRNIVKKLKGLKKKLVKHTESISKRQDVGIEWEKLGIDGIWIDESHNFKKMPIPTQMDNVKGIPTDFSQRAVDLLIKIRDVQRRTNGRNVFFASGTPVSNTLAELWVMFHATNPQMLKDFGIETFDSFATTYAEVVSNFELGWDNKFKDVTRMARFKNPGSLTLLTRMGMDVRIGNKELGLDVPDMEGGKPIIRIIKPTTAFNHWLDFLNKIVEKWEGLDPKGRFENSWVPITTMKAGSAAALDPRSAFEHGLDDPNSKANTAVRDILDEWTRGKSKRTTMMVFADMYRTLNTSKLQGFVGGMSAAPDVTDVEVPDEAPVETEDAADTGAADADAYERHAVGSFNLYHDIKAKLIAAGVPETEIAIITDYNTDVKRAALFNKVRSGAIRILMGSTEKIGEGVDVPQRMSAQFHLDPPMQMTPAKMEQRIGRIIRQGNLHSPKNWNLPVRVYMYAQERSMDAAIYQMLENKSIMVLQALKGQFLGDEFDDPAGDFTTTMVAMKAAATGDARVLELAKLQKEVRDMGLEETAFHRKVSELRRSISMAEDVAKHQKEEANKQTTLGQTIAKETADKDATVLTHKGKRYVGEKGIDEFLERARPAFEDSIKDDNTRAVMHLKLGTGVNVKIEGSTNRNFSDALVSQYSATFYIGEELNWGVPRWDSNLTSIESLMTAARGVPKFAHDRAVKAMATAKKEEEQAAAYAEAFKNTKFTKADALKEKRDRLWDLENQLREEGKKKPATAVAPTKETEVDVAPPVEDRIKAQIALVMPRLEKLDDDITRAEGRMNLTEPGSDEHEEAKADLRSLRDEFASLDGRVKDLERRLAVVIKYKYPDSNSGIPSGPALPELSIAPTPTSEGEEIVVRGLQELSMLLRDGRSGLSLEARRVAMGLINMPVMQNLDWSNLTVSLRNRIEAGYSGSADVSKNLIEMAKATGPATFPHEVFHFLYHMLTVDDKMNVEAARMQAIDQAMEHFRIAGFPPSSVPLFTKLISGKMSSDAWLQQLNRLKIEEPAAAEWWETTYDLINPGEFLAGMAGRRFAREAFESRNYTWWQSFMQKLGQWIRAIIDAVRKMFGASPTMDQIYREMLAGKRVTGPVSGVQYETGREGQIEGEPIENAGVNPADIELEITKAEEVAEKEGWVKTEVLGRKDKVRGRDMLSDAERAAGAEYAKKVFDRSGLQVTQQENGLWRLTDPDFDAEVEGRKLLDVISKEIAIQNQPGSVTGYLGNLLNSVVVNMTQDGITAFSPELKRDLYSVAQGERSQRGLLLGALAGFGKTVDYVARNVDVVLSRVYSDRFGGDQIRRVLADVLKNFRGQFTDAEIKDILDGTPAFEETVSKIIALNRRDEGGRVYRRAQSMLKPKARKKLSRLEADVRVTEAVNQILQQLKSQGIEPVPSPNKPIKPLERLLLLVQPENAEKIDKAIAVAIADAEHNAGIKAAIKNAEGAEERQDLLERFSAGEEPDEDMVEAGLNTPEFAHWKELRDNLLGYSPTTLKVVQNLIRADFAGVRYGKKAVAKPLSTKIDLGILAKQPDDEVRRVINAYSKNLDANMAVQGATDETRLRIVDHVHREVTEQLERIRTQMRNEQFANPVKKGTPVSPEQRMAQLINAGIFADDRLDVPAMVDRLAGKSALQKLAPNVGKLVTDVFSTPFYRQAELADRFAQVLTTHLNVTPEQADDAKRVFKAAFEKKLDQARTSAFKQAMSALDPEQRKVMRPGKGLWKKIEEAVNAGVFDAGVVLQSVAASHGWNVPTAGDIARIKAQAAEIQRLNELSAAERVPIGDSPQAVENALRDKRAATLEKRIALKKKIEAAWSKMTHPMRFGTQEGRKNIALAVNEFTSANLLFKLGFGPRLLLDIVTQGAIHTPTRAVMAAITRYQNDAAADRTTSLWRDIGTSLRDAYRTRLAATKANLVSARQSIVGKGDARNIDRLMSRIAVFERMEAQAEKLAGEGKAIQAGAMRLLHMISFSYRVAQTLDNFQGLPAEYQEMRQQVETALRENGMTKAEAVMNADKVIGDMQAEWALALARVNEIFTANGLTGTPNDLKAAAWQVVKSRQYARMKAIGLPADDFEEINRVIRSTVAWAEREDGGLGGVFGTIMRATTNAAANLGLPFPLARFSNAIATGINRTLTFTPMGFFPAAFGESPWFKTEEDRLQRKIEASVGTAFGLLIASLVIAGVIKVWLKPPMNKQERDLWEKEGHRANTMEIVLPDGSFIPISLLIGPGRYVAPYAAASGALVDAMERHEKAQQKLNAEAAKAGVAPGNVKALTASDYLGIAGWSAYEAVVGGRTASGLVSSFTEQNTVNVNKAVSAFISPLVPGLPALQEMTRMAGVSLDPKLATVLDFMVPLPTSAAAKTNVLGENVGTENAVQRIVQILTGGTYPFPIQPGDAHSQAGYQALYESGYRPPSINTGKGYVIDGEMRPLTSPELQKYTALRGQYLKDALAVLPDPSDRKAVQAAYRDANTRALAAVGVDTSTGTTGSATSSTRASSAPGAVASALPARRPVTGRRASVRGRRGLSRGVARRGPSVRRPRALTFRASRTRRTRGGSVRTARRRG